MVLTGFTVEHIISDFILLIHHLMLDSVDRQCFNTGKVADSCSESNSTVDELSYL